MINPKSKNLEKELFDKLSGEWWDENGKFRVLHQIRPLRIQYILDQIQNNSVKDLEILDLGCGGGLVSESLARLGANVTGIDFVNNNIKVAKEHARFGNLNINYLNLDIENLKIKKKFDVIIIFEVLEHLNNWETFIYNISQILKKNGILILSTINRNKISNFTAIFLAENILNWIPKGTHSYKKFIKPSEIRTCMDNNRFILQNIRGLIFNPLTISWQFSKDTTINYFCTYIKSN